MIAALFAAQALAIPLDAAYVPLPDVADGIAISDLADGSHVVVVMSGGVWDVDPATGAVLSHFGAGGQSVALRDPGLGIDEVVLCSSAGLQVGAWTDGPSGLASVDTEPCSAVDALPDGVLAIGGPVVHWHDDGAGGLTNPTDLGFRVFGEPVWAWSGDRVLAAAVGDTSAHEVTGTSATTVAVAAPIGGMAVGDAGWVVGLVNGHLVDLLGGDRTLGASIGRVRTADIDGDGLLDTIVSYPDSGQIGVIPGDGSAEERVGAPFGIRDLAVGDLDGDGCDEAIALDPGSPTMVVVRAQACGESPNDDRDNDGFTARYDCDDNDAQVHPDAPERCNGKDDDCDGFVDEIGIALDAPDSVDEGSELTVTATATGCVPSDLAWVWAGAWIADPQGSAPDRACSSSNERLYCTAPDDGRIDLTATAMSGRVALATRDASVTVDNLPPEVAIPDAWTQGGYGGWYPDQRTLYLWTPDYSPFTAQIGATDPGNDPISWSVDVDWIAYADGTLSIDPVDNGQNYQVATLTVADDDGGSSAWTLYVLVGSYWYGDTGGYYGYGDSGAFDSGTGDTNGSGGGCGGCCCWLTVLAIPPIPFLRRRR